MTGAFLLLLLPPLLWLLALTFCVVVIMVVLVVVVLVVLVVLRVVMLLALGLGLRLAVRVGFGDRLEEEIDVVPEVRRDLLLAGGVVGLLLSCSDRPRCGREAAWSLLCGCCFGLGRGLVDEGDGEGLGGRGGG